MLKLTTLFVQKPNKLKECLFMGKTNKFITQRQRPRHYCFLYEQFFESKWVDQVGSQSFGEEKTRSRFSCSSEVQSFYEGEQIGKNTGRGTSYSQRKIHTLSDHIYTWKNHFKNFHSCLRVLACIGLFLVDSYFSNKRRIVKVWRLLNYSASGCGA